MTEYSYTIDWLSFTATNLDNGQLFDCPDYIPLFSAQSATPHYGYRTAVEFPCGLSIMYNGATKTMGAHYQYSGRALNALRAENVTDIEILEYHAAQGHKCTRIDLALDVKGDELFEVQLSLAVNRNQRSGTARNVNEVRSLTDAGRTIYVGSRASDVFTRIYNKAAEQKVSGYWTRCEVELKGKQAQNAVLTVLAEGLPSVAAICRHLLTVKVGFDFPGWRDMLTGRLQSISQSQQPERRTRKWLLETCVKSLTRYCLEHPEENFLDVFQAAVSDMMHGRDIQAPVELMAVDLPSVLTGDPLECHIGDRERVN